MNVPLPPVEDRPHPATRQGYLIALRAALIESPYPWVRDRDKLNSFMQRAEDSISGASPWVFDCTGLCATQAWRAIGNRTGLATKAKLMALPDRPPTNTGAQPVAPPTHPALDEEAIEHLPPVAQRAILRSRDR